MNPQQYLEETPSIDFSHELIQARISSIAPSADPRETAVRIYYHVRDGFIYDPYHLDLRPQALKASVVAAKNRAWCVEKSLLMCAMLRGIGIPARLGFGVVQNHIGVEKLLEYLRRREIVFHGFVEAFLNDRWVKCTPAFDARVCRLAQVDLLEWDGITDSLFQEFDNGRKHMEYLHFYGSFPDIPFGKMHLEMRRYYPHLFVNQNTGRSFSFQFDEALAALGN